MSTQQTTLTDHGPEFDTRNQGGRCYLCRTIVNGPLHGHLTDCPARDDIWTQTHPDGDGQ